ncbi:diacylglycerol/lipid kinase family protein [Marinobacter orientalis]|uniref:YegS/Rv2252/BmrU family lipid kinase n=1 Tax=Marinobacter orientalis TaxID=1928859 RepID=A0A7Y0RDZ5_9GAMM|nr:YegS/Rv2252/BmrU family lipid kinase [Marinobacter orientalis]NMT64485.1 YegS/Rv2252/BmrU family lipid kinase [Marinobacter orientalis]TGX50556.1 YegS/Rv2252/BmrU family lipid kinase [Marinobacter orientalis]
MVYWLMANPKAGEQGSRGADFWRTHLEAAGISGIRDCSLADTGWTGEIDARDILLAAGGDGSVNAAAVLCLESGATLAVLPSGTANDFARNLKLPADPRQICNLVAAGRTRRVDVAIADQGMFLNVAHIGLGTLAVRESSGETKRFLGRFSYVAALLQKLSAYRGFHGRIETRTGNVTGRWLTIAVSSGAFFGGGNEIPEASAGDGQLDVIAVRPRSMFQLLLTFLTVRLRRSSPKRTSTVVHLKSPEVRVTTRSSKTVTMDGEIAGKTPLDAKCRPACLEVICEGLVTT